MKANKSIFDLPEYWSNKNNPPVEFFPTTKSEMNLLGWDSCDIILVTGDAYIDHPSFGMALISRLLEAKGYKVGIIDQPDWNVVTDFQRLGKPNLFFGVTSGNMDSMINRYTADKKIRSDDAYSPDNLPNMRPDRSTIVFSQRCKEAYKEVKVVIGGIEASLRRLAHYDYWSDKVRRSILSDSKAEILIYGNGERQILEVAHRIAFENDLLDIRGTVTKVNISAQSELMEEIDCTQIGSEGKIYTNLEKNPVRIPSFKDISTDKRLFAYATRLFYLQTNPQSACPIIQEQGGHDIIHQPPAYPLSTEELDFVYELPYSRAPHPKYNDKKMPAFEMIKHSVTIMRGCFGGCSFCSITAHEGKGIQSRSEESILREIEMIRETDKTFTGVISDIGGPSANMYQMGCKNKEAEAKCRRFSCLHPNICENLNTDHSKLLQLYKSSRELPGIKKIVISSGIRHELALRSKKYIKEIAVNHTGGYLKIAPEHTENEVLRLMQKPERETFDRFMQLFYQYSAQASKEQYIIPYFIAGHPGSTHKSMINLAIWLKKNKYKLDQVQNFYPTPMTLATAMYFAGISPLTKISNSSKDIYSATKGRDRRIQKALLRYHDRKNQNLIVEILNSENRSDMIGMDKNCLVQPIKSYRKSEEAKSRNSQNRSQRSKSKATRSKKTMQNNRRPSKGKK